jgi:5,10-methylenetetrahydrofolate reductase
MGLQSKIRSGQFFALAEFETPKGADLSTLLASANLVKGRVEAIVIPEMGSAVMRISSLGGCAFLQLRGFETVLQVCCRDRNRLALQADILAAAALGVPNLMAVSGEPIHFGDHHRAREVYDLDLPQILEGIQGLQKGKDMAGIELRGTPPTFFAGTTLNAGATGGALDIEMEELGRRMELGVEFAITTPVFDMRRFASILKRVDASRLAVIPTVLLLKSAGMARYIDRNIPNISIPAEMIQTIQKAPDKIRECIKIAAELVRGLRDMGVPGVMISTIGWEDKLPQVLDEARI